MPQPNFVPVMPSTSRSTQSSGISGGTSTSRRSPLMVIAIMCSPPRKRHVSETELQTDVGRVVHVLHVLGEPEREDQVVATVPDPEAVLVLHPGQLVEIRLVARIHALAHVRLQVHVGVRGQLVLVAQ